MVSADSTQKRKLNVSMMLKVPIDLEIEVLGLPLINHQNTEEQPENFNSLNLLEVAEPEIIVNGAKLADLDENSQAIVAQIVNQLQQTDKVVAPLSANPEPQDNLENNEQQIVEPQYYINTTSLEEFTVIQAQTQKSHTKKKIKVRLLDSVNDAFAFGVNTMATMLFLGKLANYSWD